VEIVAMQIETNVFGPSTGIPMWINYLCVPLSGAIVCLRLIGEIVVYTGEIIVLSKKGVQ
jgi:TRAP-type C4-dicarboxylate transport system permease small subunit